MQDTTTTSELRKMKDLNLESFFFYTHVYSHQLDLKNKFTELM